MRPKYALSISRRIERRVGLNALGRLTNFLGVFLRHQRLHRCCYLKPIQGKQPTFPRAGVSCHLISGGECCRPSSTRESTMSKASLDNRHRNKDGEIGDKHGNTLIRTLRKVYGQSFAAGYPETEKLSEVLLQLNETSLSQLRRDHETGHLEHKIATLRSKAATEWQRPYLRCPTCRHGRWQKFRKQPGCSNIRKHRNQSRHG